MGVRACVSMVLLLQNKSTPVDTLKVGVATPAVDNSRPSSIDNNLFGHYLVGISSHFLPFASVTAQIHKKCVQIYCQSEFNAKLIFDYDSARSTDEHWGLLM